MSRSVRVMFLGLIAALTVGWLKLHAHTAELERAVAEVKR
jgi:hypothetical protein